ncbi:MAG: lipoyl synthase [Pseudomonadota bacterium]|uniref:lipoyl synthase n=1 Tax=Thermithiobacillus tepidarius TaxID=929 RepID=UPI000429EB95|nr:lipoyl synthase [Thermithiobacillus tepidarius]
MQTGKPVIPLHAQRAATPNCGPMPAWIRQPLGDAPHFGLTQHAVHQHALHTVCEEAKCPNRGECWSRGTATFMILGDICTRACGFCAVKTGKPGSAPDADEPRRVAEAAARMGLKYVVITSVNRDDQPDGGAGIFAATMRLLRARQPAIGIELLTPDFRNCQEAALRALAGHSPFVWGHNMETVPRLYKAVRPGADYARSLRLLAAAAALPGVEAKSALMLGLGETTGEVLEVLRDLRAAGVRRLALGQYLRPSMQHLPVRAYIEPARFTELETAAREMGFTWVKAGPLVRSSYHAED